MKESMRIGNMVCGILCGRVGERLGWEGEHRFYTCEYECVWCGGYHSTMYISINVSYE